MKKTSFPTSLDLRARVKARPKRSPEPGRDALRLSWRRCSVFCDLNLGTQEGQTAFAHSRHWRFGSPSARCPIQSPRPLPPHVWPPPARRHDLQCPLQRRSDLVTYIYQCRHLVLALISMFGSQPNGTLIREDSQCGHTELTAERSLASSGPSRKQRSSAGTKSIPIRCYPFGMLRARYPSRRVAPRRLCHPVQSSYACA